ncbi:MAG: PIN domain-containing protein [Candidatus Nanopelagicales bacterium]|nr:PIN domain-containing protein [Candidatus Nanopelagicales bacterium]
MSFVVVYDANVLYPNALRDLLIRVAQAGLVQARWSDQILDETFAALRSNRPDVPEPKWHRLRELMSRAIRDGLVVGYESLIDAVQGLPDPDDRHVVAADSRTPQLTPSHPCDRRPPGVSGRSRQTRPFGYRRARSNECFFA